jgi:hypothetical protein
VAPATPTPPPLAATVNGEYITLSEFEIELAQVRLRKLREPDPADDASKAVLGDLIAQVLLSSRAR